MLNKDNEKEILKLCCEFAECEFESIDKMLRDNSFYAETYYAGNIIDNTFIDFLIRAKKSTYANSTIKKVAESRVGSSDYNYEEIIDNKKYTYHDTYFGGIKFMGEEVVYCNDNKPIWGMNYYGVTYDDALGEEAMDNALRPALMKVGEDRNIIPAIRGYTQYEHFFKQPLEIITTFCSIFFTTLVGSLLGAVLRICTTSSKLFTVNSEIASSSVLFNLAKHPVAITLAP